MRFNTQPDPHASKRSKGWTFLFSGGAADEQKTDTHTQKNNQQGNFAKTCRITVPHARRKELRLETFSGAVWRRQWQSAAPSNHSEKTPARAAYATAVVKDNKRSHPLRLRHSVRELGGERQVRASPRGRECEAPVVVRWRNPPGGKTRSHTFHLRQRRQTVGTCCRSAPSPMGANVWQQRASHSLTGRVIREKVGIFFFFCLQVEIIYGGSEESEGCGYCPSD